ncbi:CAP domain-containing protein [Bradyrhizobium sp.]|uniref:CAP domain-containing protein n=1 Tax=Bradyrhizobium sp. TaxID=376 RepID=UPI001ED3DE5A|nr:CAP domain-containing protein [Bradyrhizobium sp.]MBV8920787.1 CAP domain-containing protein [Bradyrhizobium sp.]MBV9983604.1 CAP domain-containing protein [Bradyrhizobium sp.]
MRWGATKPLILAAVLTLSAHSALAESAAELISHFRAQHGEARVTRDATLDRIAEAQAHAMASREQLGHEVLGSFSSRIAPSGAGRAAENIAYGYDNFEKTLQQWIDSSEHRKNLLLHNASRVGIASARDASGKRTYWAMEIAGDYDKPGKRIKEPLVAVAKPATTSTTRREAATCHIKIMSLCL